MFTNNLTRKRTNDLEPIPQQRPIIKDNDTRPERVFSWLKVDLPAVKQYTFYSFHSGVRPGLS